MCRRNRAAASCRAILRTKIISRAAQSNARKRGVEEIPSRSRNRASEVVCAIESGSMMSLNSRNTRVMPKASRSEEIAEMATRTASHRRLAASMIRAICLMYERAIMLVASSHPWPDWYPEERGELVREQLKKGPAQPIQVAGPDVIEQRI